ncbi:MAG: alpha/beta hydrolase [Nitrospiraceae bacterium]|nr:alpha/beta hydrolase [Nitrospiraceae bacterium]
MPIESYEWIVRLPASGDVEALFLRPPDARWLLALAHGAGAGMHHPFMDTLARELGAYRVATFRYQFPYMHKRRKTPDSPTLLTATVRAALATATEAAPDLPLLAGGKSLGGRMTSLALSGESSPEEANAVQRVRGLVFFGFPLHPPGRPSVDRAGHLERVRVPMLFLQGTRDTFADLALLRPLCTKLAPRTTLQTVETADHSFHVLKRSGTTDAEVLRELARAVGSWAESLT